MLTFTEICEIIDERCGTNSNTYTLAKKARDVNLAALRLQMLAIEAEGKFQVDDFNHTKDPVLTADLISGQRDYHFATDEQGNVILDIYKVMVKDQNGLWLPLDKVDQQADDSEENPVSQMLSGQNITGVPDKYDKSWNGIFLDPIPSYSWRVAVEGSGGLKFWVNREHNYFISTDTSKSLGFGHAFHEYMPLRASYQKLRLQKPAEAKLLYADLIEMEKDIKNYFSRRSKDEQLVFTSETINPY